ncbi:PREDICTED: uncharacterized protein LOC108758352 [Trachymyrmex cornetzi]|uniref:Sarcoplasmic calcium-binding proteins II, V, VI, and VII n=1 Tax=Trachymyrmex cornetzi TaxID=471704 RepID=A0A151JS48_9HYME|nr:PREDICTED: uncharacterized protein LOC108758352 [Trachymyrmex cornetzi]KYN30199.1 hypothetical protein ALC57_00336 [Trachymyrmex cornetzi]
MESRSGSIKDPMYYPENDGTSSGGGEQDKSQRDSLGSQEISLDDNNALKVPRKFITNWRQACDRTRDRTKDLLKRWRTTSSNVDELAVAPVVAPELEQPGWSVHVWTTWVSRFPSDDSLSAIEFSKSGGSEALAPIQRDKFSHFFTYLLDHDKDGYINRKDFSLFSERLRRFADWSWNGPEYLRLLEIENGFAGLVLQDKKGLAEPNKKIDLEAWLSWWAQIVAPPDGASYNDMPFWVKVMPRVFFLAINSSGSGMISKKELAAFYGSVVGLDTDRINKCLDIAYNSLTSNGDHPLGWAQYQLVFANFLFGRGPFGPGEHFLGMTDACMIRGNTIPFPIDYSAMNTPRDKLEVYSPHCKSNRRSVVV